MKQEDKELLLKDLCARLPYGVKVAIEDDYLYSGKIITGMTKSGLIYINPFSYKLDQVKPYLFPISSMAEEQIEEFNDLTRDVFVHKSGECNNINEYNNNTTYSDIDDWLISINYLNAHHFDYRCLIDKGLAIDATNLNIY